MADVIQLADRLKDKGNKYGWVDDGLSGRVRHLALIKPLPVQGDGYTALIKPLCRGMARPMHPATAASPLPWCATCIADSRNRFDK